MTSQPISRHRIKWYNSAAFPLVTAALGAVVAVNAARGPVAGGPVRWGLVVGATVVAAVGVIATVWIRRRIGSKIDLTAEGVLWHGRSSQTWTWDRLMWTMYTPRGSSTRKLRLWLDGKPLEMDSASVSEPDHLLSTLDATGARHVAARLQAAMNGGPPVVWRQFVSGAISIDGVGVSDGKRTIPWHDLAMSDNDVLFPRSQGAQFGNLITLDPANLPCPGVVLAMLEWRQPRLRAPRL